MNQATYQKGSHAIVDIEEVDITKLKDVHTLIHLWKNWIDACELHILGEVVHTFEHSGGFTAVICLSESHMSIHTWPEAGRLTFDVFLSNYQKVNDGHVSTIVAKTKEYFGGNSVLEKMIQR